MYGCSVGGLSQAPSETVNDCRTEVLQVIWDSVPQGPVDKAVKEFSKRLKACVAAEGGHFEHSQILQCRDCYICLNDVIAWTYFERAKIARWQHCNAVNFRIL